MTSCRYEYTIFKPKFEWQTFITEQKVYSAIEQQMKQALTMYF